VYRQVLRWISSCTPSDTFCAWSTNRLVVGSVSRPSSSSSSGSAPAVASGAYWMTWSSDRLANMIEPPGSPCRPDRPRSWSSSLLDG
jgi:hypothetical protein